MHTCEKGQVDVLWMSGVRYIFLDLCIIMMLIHENNVLELQMATKFKVCDPCGWVFIFMKCH